MNTRIRRLGLALVLCYVAAFAMLNYVQVFRAESLNEHLREFRAKRAELAADPGIVDAVLADGANRAREAAAATMDEVRKAMHI